MLKVRVKPVRSACPCLMPGTGIQAKSCSLLTYYPYLPQTVQPNIYVRRGISNLPPIEITAGSLVKMLPRVSLNRKQITETPTINIIL